MVLLNHLFEGNKGIAKELVMDDKKRLTLLIIHLTNFTEREELSRHFNHANINKAVENILETIEILDRIKALISSELVNISNEMKTDEEILEDLKSLKSKDEIIKLSHVIFLAEQPYSAILELFHEIFKVLKTELHLIELIRKRPDNLEVLLRHLFYLIFHHEALLYKVFREQYFDQEDNLIHKNIMEIARAIILEEEVKEVIETDEENFTNELFIRMSSDESKHNYRKLGEYIFRYLADMAGAPLLMGEDIIELIRQIEGLMKHDEIMYRIVKSLKPKYKDTKIREVILAFRKAYDLDHFEGLKSEFGT